MKKILLELGIEEIPARLLNPTLDQLRNILEEWIIAKNIDPDFPDSDSELRVSGTPRRLVVELSLPAEQQDVEDKIKGPPAHVAYEDDAPTRALRGFCSQHDLDPEAVEIEAMDGGEYVVARKLIPGQPVEKCFGEDLEKLLLKLNWPRKMRWESSGFEFIRPLRWILAFSGSEPLSLQVGPVESGETSRGLRFTDKARFSPGNPEEYFTVLSDQDVVLSPRLRSKRIRDKAKELAAEIDGSPVFPSGLLEEVTNLVESPAPFLGEFDRRFLELPEPVLIKTMVAHQKYIPVARPDSDELMPYFIGVRNGCEKGLDVVSRGNERVIRARLSDAEFFYQKDLQTNYEDYRDRLKGVVFQEKLGSLYEKTERLASLVESLSPLADKYTRVARHCKNDRVTEMVDELADLQGTMGRIYACESGWSPELAELIETHYKPLDSEGELPGNKIGCWLSLLDKLDTLVGFFGLGRRPTGSADPYGLRREALGIIRLGLEGEIDFDLAILARQVAGEYRSRDVEINSADVRELLQFIRERFYQLLRSQDKFKESEISAVLELYGLEPNQAHRRLKWLKSWRNQKEFEAVITAAGRVGNIIGDVEIEESPRPEKFEKQSEQKLWAVFEEKSEQIEEAVEAGEPDKILANYRELKKPIDQFFESVMVNCEDPDLRQNRHALLGKIYSCFALTADFTKL